jgi:hypothetical protein
MARAMGRIWLAALVLGLVVGAASRARADIESVGYSGIVVGDGSLGVVDIPMFDPSQDNALLLDVTVSVNLRVNGEATVEPNYTGPEMDLNYTATATAFSVSGELTGVLQLPFFQLSGIELPGIFGSADLGRDTSFIGTSDEMDVEVFVGVTVESPYFVQVRDLAFSGGMTITYTYEISPEPSTALAAAIAGLTGLGYAWRRRQAKAAA